jgi:hypothetical protein
VFAVTTKHPIVTTVDSTIVTYEPLRVTLNRLYHVCRNHSRIGDPPCDDSCISMCGHLMDREYGVGCHEYGHADDCVVCAELIGIAVI